MKYSLSLTGEVFFSENIENNLDECNITADKLFNEIVEVAENNSCEVLMFLKLLNDKYSQQFSHHSIYRHFKGKYYATIDKSLPLNDTELKSLIETKLSMEDNYSIDVQHTEKTVLVNGQESAKIDTAYCIDGAWYHSSDFDTQELCLYKALYNNELTYARPMDMFLSPVDKNKYPDASQEFRFELCK